MLTYRGHWLRPNHKSKLDFANVSALSTTCGISYGRISGAEIVNKIGRDAKSWKEDWPVNVYILELLN